MLRAFSCPFRGSVAHRQVTANGSASAQFTFADRIADLHLRLSDALFFRIRTLLAATLTVIACLLVPGGVRADVTDYGNVGESDPPLRDCRAGNPAQLPKYDGDYLRLVHEPLDRHLCIVAANDTPLLLLRSALVIVVAARYGAASIERYGDSRSDMAVRLIPKVNAALAALAEALKQSTDPYFEVYRADLVVSTAELIAAASEPTRTELRGLFGASFDVSLVTRAFKLVRNALVDELYGRAYREAFIQQVGSVKEAEISDNEYRKVIAHLNQRNGGCKRLEALAAGTEMKCKIPESLATASTEPEKQKP